MEYGVTIYEKDEHLPGYLTEVNIQSNPSWKQQARCSRALVVFDKTTSAAISYFSDRGDVAGFLSLIHQVFIVYNSKERFNPSNKLGNDDIQGGHKPEFLRAVADWVKEWSTLTNFPLTKRIAHTTYTCNSKCTINQL